MMKKYLILLSLLIASAWLTAQNSIKISYQAVVRNLNNQLVVQEDLTITFHLHNHSPLAPATYTEQHIARSNQNGLVSLIIGEGTHQTGDLENVEWNDAYICTQYELEGETVLADTQKINGVPYAYYAEKVPLSAIEEHLGSTSFVTINMLQDSLSQYIKGDDLQNSLSLYVPRNELADSLNHFVPREELTDSLNHFVPRNELTDSLNHYVPHNELSDSLSHYARHGEWNSSLGQLVPRQEFLDSLAQITNNQGLAAMIQNLQNQIDELQSVRETIDLFTISSTPSNTFTLSYPPLSNHPVMMFINGVFISSQAVSISGATLTYRSNYNGNKQLTEGDRIQIYYSHN